MAIDAGMEAGVDGIAAGVSALVTAMGSAYVESEAAPSGTLMVLRRHASVSAMLAGIDLQRVAYPADKSRCETHVEVLETDDEVYLICRIKK